MPATFLGVRHHSPACARLVRDVIREQRPAYVLIEGPADMNARLDEVLLGHELPIAVFTSYRDELRRHASWSPFCEHSPEWVAMTEGRRAGAEIRFIDLPAWHPALSDTSNRYADAERRYTDALSRLCSAFAVDNVDALWDHLFEIEREPDLQAQLVAYFDLIRGDAEASEQDQQREAYMARWVSAAVHEAADLPVVVVTGGFHRPALVTALATSTETAWPELPVMPADAVGGSYLVPFSFRRLDSFDGYQSGMPSPAYYQQLWDEGTDAAGAGIVTAVAQRLRGRRQPVSTADLIAARTLSLGLAQLRGHSVPGRLDVLEGLVSALVTDPLDQPVPWSRRGRLQAGTDPVVVEMVAALSGDAVGRLHPSTPQPPLVHDVTAELERHGIAEHGDTAVDLTTEHGLRASRVLHQLRVLGIAGVRRTSGPVAGGDPVLRELWHLGEPSARLATLIEASSYGANLLDASAAALGDRLTTTGSDPAALAALLFDAVLCGVEDLSHQVLSGIGVLIGGVREVGALGELLTTALGLWRHDQLLGAAGNIGLAAVVDAATRRGLWLVEGLQGGGPAPADDRRLTALVGIRDAVVHAEPVLSVDRDSVLGVMRRCTAPNRPSDLRGAALGMIWALEDDGQAHDEEVRRAVRLASRPDVLGDFLCGVFALSREQVLTPGAGIVDLLDEILTGYGEDDFLVAVPALRLSFSWFPPREREQIALLLLSRRGISAPASTLLRLPAGAAGMTHARAVEARVADLLEREALLHG